MPTVTVLTAARMLEIENNSIINVSIVDDDLIFTKHNGTTINTGPVLQLTAPNGTKYRLLVSNAGTLSTTPI